jgi:hypothetical protein
MLGISHIPNKESTAVWNLKPERWGSPLVQEEKFLWRETMIMMIILILRVIQNLKSLSLSVRNSFTPPFMWEIWVYRSDFK